ncbi:MAG: hypothetical protein GY764_15415 [Halieaceae bacterium]|nr:hypothetical protein [Halieaceae bacterium]
MTRRILLSMALFLAASSMPVAAEYDYFKNAQLPGVRRAEVSLDNVTDEAPADGVPTGYQRRTVEWFPKKGVDIVDAPKGALLRTWTINPESRRSSKQDVKKWWPISVRDKKQFKAHLLGFRGIGIGIGNPWAGSEQRSREGFKDYMAPSVVLRLEDGRKRCFSRNSFSEADEKIICDLYEKEMKKLRDATFEKGIEWKVSPAANRSFPKGTLYEPGTAQIESKHFVAVLGSQDPEDPKGTLWLMNNNKERAALNRKLIMRGWEDWWAYLEYAGHLMPYWEKTKEKYKYAIQIGGTKKNGAEILSRGAGGSYGGMTTGNGSWWAVYHEWTHGQLNGGMVSVGGGETMCDGAQNMGDPLSASKAMFQVTTPWKNLFWGSYPGAYTWMNMGDDPNWGYCAVGTIPPLMAPSEHTPMHAIARLGEKRGIFKNGVRGVGDMLGQIGARMAEFDTELQGSLRSTFTMPTRTALREINAKKRIYRSPMLYAPEPFGVNLIRLVPDEGAKTITVDFQGHFDPVTHSDWRACIVAVDAEGRCRYSPLWNKDKMTLATKAGDRRYWLTVTATPYALSPSTPSGGDTAWTVNTGGFAHKYPYDVQLTGARAGSPHTTSADNDVLGQPGEITGMRRGEGANCAAIPDVTQASGKRHSNGGGWVADSATVDETAYVGPNAMVLDGAKVLGNAAVLDYAIVMGSTAVLKDNARVYGKVTISGAREYGGNARVYRRDEGGDFPVINRPQWRQAQYEPLQSRFVQKRLALQANYECDMPDVVTLEDYFRERSTGVFYYGAHRSDLITFDGMLRGRPGFAKLPVGGALTFNGKDQYAQLPGEAVDLEEITLNLRFQYTGSALQTLYELGTTEGKTLNLSVNGNQLTLQAGESQLRLGQVSPDTWITCRVELDGQNIAAYVDGKNVAKKASTFRMADGYEPSTSRLGYLAAARHGKTPLRGKIDFFRVYNIVYPDFSKAPVPLISPRTIPTDFVARFDKAFPDYEVQVLEVEATVGAHPANAFYTHYNKVVEKRLEDLRTADPAKLKAIDQKIEAAQKTLAAMEQAVRDEEKNDQAFQAKRQAAQDQQREIHQKLEALRNKNEKYVAAKTLRDKTREILNQAKGDYLKQAETQPEYIKLGKEFDANNETLKQYNQGTDKRAHVIHRRQNLIRQAREAIVENFMKKDPVLAQALRDNKISTKAERDLYLGIRHSAEGSALMSKAEALNVRFVPSQALASKKQAAGTALKKLEGQREVLKKETAYEENPAEFRALIRTRYLGHYYDQTLKKAIRAQIPIPTDDIEQVRKAMAYQKQPWYTTVSWDGRTAYEMDSESVKQPVMQMFLKKMKPWIYK